MTNRLSDQEIQKIIIAYQSGVNISDIQKQLNYNPSTIVKYLKLSNIEIKNHIKNTINHNIFKNIDTSDKAYVLGFILADGWITKGNSLGIQLKGSDVDLLKNIAKILTPDDIVKLYHRKKYKCEQVASLQLYSKEITDDLKSLGCVPTKSLVLNMTPKLIESLNGNFCKDFVRGYFDGDGCFYIKRQNNKIRSVDAHFLGTQMFLSDIQKFLTKNNIYSVLRKYKNIYRLSIERQSDLVKFIDFIYPEEKSIFLERKYLKAKEIKDYCLRSY